MIIFFFCSLALALFFLWTNKRKITCCINIRLVGAAAAAAVDSKVLKRTICYKGLLTHQHTVHALIVHIQLVCSAFGAGQRREREKFRITLRFRSKPFQLPFNDTQKPSFCFIFISLLSTYFFCVTVCCMLLLQERKNTEAIADKNKMQRERDGEEDGEENGESHKSEPKPIKFCVLQMAYTAIQYDNNSC